MKKKKVNLKEADRYSKFKTVEEWICKGFCDQNIRIMIEEKFDLTSATAQNKLIAEAKEEINKRFNPEPLRSIIINQIQNVVDECRKDKDHSNALKGLSKILDNVTPKDPKTLEIQDGDKIYKAKFSD